MRVVLGEWLEVRSITVSTKTHIADKQLLQLVPTSIQAMQVSAVSEREVARPFETLLRAGLSEASVVRYRASLSAFFAWCESPWVSFRLIRQDGNDGQVHERDA